MIKKRELKRERISDRAIIKKREVEKRTGWKWEDNQEEKSVKRSRQETGSVVEIRNWKRFERGIFESGKVGRT